jgi:hypothetical protein
LRLSCRNSDGDYGFVIDTAHIELRRFAKQKLEAADEVSEAVIGGDVGE